MQKIGLATEERRDLQHVDHICNLRALVRFMHVGENRYGELVADLREDRQGMIEPDATIAPGTGAVRLVE